MTSKQSFENQENSRGSPCLWSVHLYFYWTHAFLEESTILLPVTT